MHVELKEGQIDQKFVPPQMTSGKVSLFLPSLIGKNAVSYFSSGSIKLTNSTAVNFVM